MPDSDLFSDTVLQLAPGIRTRWDAAGHVLVDSPVGTIIDIGPRGFAVLALFSRPLRLGDAVEQLEAELAGSTEFAPTMSVINMLIEEGALFAPLAGRSQISGWADPVEHARMLHDERRTGDFLAALAAAVRPGDVVLDIGTGSGVLAVAAARAGARHVYAVEASDIAGVAERVFEANGVADRVTLLPGWSRQIDLPEPADLLVAEIIGNEQAAHRTWLHTQGMCAPAQATSNVPCLASGPASRLATTSSAPPRWTHACRQRSAPARPSDCRSSA